MIPIRDGIPTRRVPVVNYLLIAVNILVFILQALAGTAQENIMLQYSLIPANFREGITLPNLLDIFTSMFMHAGIAHIAGNMLYLWIFGDNVEDAMGSIKYLIFYLIGGVAASAVHVFTNPGSQIPTVGASGAIAAVLGAYLILFPQSKVQTFIPIGFFMRMAVIPAIVVLGFWFLMQVFTGVMSWGGPDVGGVAVWAHVGGFVAGLILAKIFAAGRHQPVRGF